MLAIFVDLDVRVDSKVGQAVTRTLIPLGVVMFTCHEEYWAGVFVDLNIGISSLVQFRFFVDGATQPAVGIREALATP